MHIFWGIALVALGALAWIGQTISFFAPATAARFGLAEAENDVEPVFAADVRGEAAWDFVTLWTLMVAGILLIVDSSAWPCLGLIGGGIYVYFGGRGILARLEMQRRGFRIGSPENVRIGYSALAIWGIAGLITIVAAILELN